MKRTNEKRSDEKNSRMTRAGKDNLRSRAASKRQKVAQPKSIKETDLKADRVKAMSKTSQKTSGQSERAIKADRKAGVKRGVSLKGTR